MKFSLLPQPQTISLFLNLPFILGTSNHVWSAAPLHHTHTPTISDIITFHPGEDRDCNNLNILFAGWYNCAVINWNTLRGWEEVYIFPFTLTDRQPITLFYRSPSAPVEAASQPSVVLEGFLLGSVIGLYCWQAEQRPPWDYWRWNPCDSSTIVVSNTGNLGTILCALKVGISCGA